MKLLSIDGTTGTIETGMRVDIGGLEICTAGDYVLITNGVAVQKVSADDARAMRSTIKQTHDELSDRS